MFSPKIYACVCSGRRLSISLIGNQTNTTPPNGQHISFIMQQLTQITEQRFEIQVLAWKKNNCSKVDRCLLGVDKRSRSPLDTTGFPIDILQTIFDLGQKWNKPQFWWCWPDKTDWRLLLQGWLCCHHDIAHPSWCPPYSAFTPPTPPLLTCVS